MSKGGSSTTQAEIPDWIAEPAQRNIARAEASQQLGYMPYYGPDVAAFNPTQLAAMQANIGAAQTFGLAPAGMTAAQGMPAPTDFGGGMMGYSSGPLFELALAELMARRPGQVQAYNQLFVDPLTGQPSMISQQQEEDSNKKSSAERSKKDEEDMQAALRAWRSDEADRNM